MGSPIIVLHVKHVVYQKNTWPKTHFKPRHILQGFLVQRSVPSSAEGVARGGLPEERSHRSENDVAGAQVRHHDEDYASLM